MELSSFIRYSFPFLSLLPLRGGAGNRTRVL